MVLTAPLLFRCMALVLRAALISALLPWFLTPLFVLEPVCLSAALFAALAPRFLTPLFDWVLSCLWTEELLYDVLVREADVAFADAVVRLLYLGSPVVDPFELPVVSLAR